MNIYGSLMDIYDEKNKDVCDEKNKRHLCRKKTRTQTKKLYAPIINRNI